MSDTYTAFAIFALVVVYISTNVGLFFWCTRKKLDSFECTEP